MRVNESLCTRPQPNPDDCTHGRCEEPLLLCPVSIRTDTSHKRSATGEKSLTNIIFMIMKHLSYQTCVYRMCMLTAFFGPRNAEKSALF